MASFDNVTYSESMALSDRIFHPVRIAATKRLRGAGENEYETDGYMNPRDSWMRQTQNLLVSLRASTPTVLLNFRGILGLIDEITRVVLAQISSSRRETLCVCVNPIKAHNLMGASPF